MKGSNETYGLFSIMFHWFTFVLVVLIIPLGWIMDEFTGQLEINLHRYHVALGITIGVIVTFRFLWTLFDKKPDPPSKMTGSQFLLYRWNHYGLYGMLAVMIISGSSMLFRTNFLSLLSGDIDNRPGIFLQDEISSKIHQFASYLLIFLIAMHSSGVLIHHYTKESVLHRMGVNLSGKSK